MSLTVENYRVLYNANGVQTSFAIPQTFFSDSDNIKVRTRDESTTPATETDMVEGVDYTVSGSNVLFGSAPASGLKVGIFREMDIEQELDLIAGGPFPVESLETQLDKLVAIAQQLNGMIARALKVQKTSDSLNLELPEPVAGSFLKWNATEDALENDDGSGFSSSITSVVGETPSGALNGLVFGMAHEPIAGTLKVYINGERSLDFSYLTTALTLGFAPGLGGSLIIDYEY